MSARKHPLPAEKARMAAIVDRLKAVYPHPVCALEWQSEASLSPEATEADRLRDSWRLLVMARLSAQCTDARVNIVCRDLFARYDTPAELGKASQEDIEAIIRPCGLFRTKAESIRAACRILAEDYDGIVPDDMDALLALPGVGRKIANLILGDVYHRPAVVTDTHCMRICGHLGFYPKDLKDPPKIERILAELIEPCEQSDFCHRIVQFGRDTCRARAPQCRACPLADLCPAANDTTDGA